MAAGHGKPDEYGDKYEEATTENDHLPPPGKDYVSTEFFVCRRSIAFFSPRMNSLFQKRWLARRELSREK
jgi:hypothetical protein